MSFPRLATNISIRVKVDGLLNVECIRQPIFFSMCAMLSYRKAVSGDIPFIFQCYNEKTVAERASLIFENNYTEFQRNYSDILRDPAFYVRILKLKDESVGFIQFRETDKDTKEAEGCIWLGRKRDLGYGLNAFYLLLHISFEDLRYERLWGWVRENNEPMNRICQRFGLRIIDSCERPAWKKDSPGHFEKIFYYEITSEEYGFKKGIFARYGMINRKIIGD